MLKTNGWNVRFFLIARKTRLADFILFWVGIFSRYTDLLEHSTVDKASHWLIRTITAKIRLCSASTDQDVVQLNGECSKQSDANPLNRHEYYMMGLKLGDNEMHSTMWHYFHQRTTCTRYVETIYFSDGQSSAARDDRKKPSSYIFYFSYVNATIINSSFRLRFFFRSQSSVFNVHCSEFCCLFRFVVRFVGTCKYYI